MMKKTCILLFHLCLCWIVISCANTPAGVDDTRVAASVGDSGSTEDTFLRETAVAQTVSLAGEIDRICGLVSDGDNGLIIVGMRGDVPRMVKTDIEGKAISSCELEEVTEDTNHILHIGVDMTGGFIAVCADRENIRASTDAWLVRYDADGLLCDRFPLEELGNDCHGARVTSDGTVLAWNNTGIFVFDDDGSTSLITAWEDGIEPITVIEKDDDLYAVVHHWTDFGICPVHLEEGIFGGFSLCRNNVISCYTPVSGMNDALLLNAQEMVYEYDVSKDVFVPRFRWSDIGWDGNYAGYDVNGLVSIDDTTLICAASTDKIYLIHTEKENVELQTITVGALRTDDARELERFVAYHNSVSTEYHAEIKYYEDENQIRLDIASGNAPDILELRGVNIPLNDQNFLDLLPYIERDESLTTEDFSGNLPEALKVDGKIHLIPDSFSVYTLKGRSDDVGDEPGWSLQDLEKLLEEKDDQVRAFSAGMPPEAILHWFYIASMEQLVDLEHHSCDFTSDTFIDMLRFCASPQMKADSEKYAENDSPLLTFMWVQSVDVLLNANAVWSGHELVGREAVTYIGFLNTERNCGSAFGAGYSEQQYAIPANSRHPEAAWAYLRVMLDSGWQKKTRAIPVMEADMRDAIEEKLAQNEITWEEAGIDRFMELLERMDDYAYEYNTISEIIQEEAQACFSGEKSAEETAALIQNRVTLYLNEIKPGGE